MTSTRAFVEMLHNLYPLIEENQRDSEPQLAKRTNSQKPAEM